jgi:hypothetical protein
MHLRYIGPLGPFIVGGTGFEFTALYLLGRHSTTGVFARVGQDHYASLIARMTGMHHHAKLMG